MICRILVDPLERRRVALADHRVDMGAELAIKEKMNPLRRDQTALGVGGPGRRRRNSASSTTR